MNSTEAGLRRFGMVMAGALAAVALAAVFRGRGWWPFPAGVSLMFALVARLSPRILAPVEWFWMKLSGVMGFVVTNVLLTVFFFLVITPAGLLMRLLGKDPLKIRSTSCDSFWEKIEPDGPGERPDRPY